MESVIVVGSMFIGVLALSLFARWVKQRGRQSAMAMGARIPERLAQMARSNEEKLQLAARFADPIAGRSLVERAFGSVKWVRPEGVDMWRVGLSPDSTFVVADWRVVDGAGILAATRGVGMLDTLTAGPAWADALERVTRLAEKEGIPFDTTTSPLAPSGERVKKNIVWERV